MHERPRVLITDFDGTITKTDFFRLVTEHLLSPEDMGPWEEYLAGTRTHFSALQTIFGKIRAPEGEVVKLLPKLEPDPLLPGYISALKSAGWEVLVTSAGCDWYIRRILDGMGVSLDVYSNPGVYHPGGPLELIEPVDSPFYSPEIGVSKAAIVQHHLDRGALVIYAGDGKPDLEPALLLPPGKRYARSHLAEALDIRDEGYIRFNVWSDVAWAILSGETSGRGTAT